LDASALQQMVTREAVWGSRMNVGEDLKKARLGGGFKDFLFSPLPGEMIQFD